jgi:hypothetical protein
MSSAHFRSIGGVSPGLSQVAAAWRGADSARWCMVTSPAGAFATRHRLVRTGRLGIVGEA